ncbi:MAG: 50S ribosomal protein L17 [Planctomycetota bacterium]|nr:MAG: 50S ribosomal protein L17 [Planctomycetota bacterium]REJ93059.1 MAG: 50S ribosomal protein L17 [Planctomycetota bacterium]REK30047.1 MAG: 50S ribosomal protein L17 [Planctomycetota bacterium]REK37711.1 MAG: 50S ribosomal protein L17 [Planctomycetota bacterium]
MRHRLRGRKLGRSHSHRKAMLNNMAASLIRTVRIDEDDPGRPRTPGRIVTTVPKAKELRPMVEKLITLAKKARPHEERAEEFATTAERNTSEWKSWRESDQWQQWAAARAPAVAARRRAFSILRDDEAVDILFDELADRFIDRPGGYTRIVRIAARRLGDAGEQALIEFVGERDRVRRQSAAPAVVPTSADESEEEPAAEDQAAADDNEEMSRDETAPEAESAEEGAVAESADEETEETKD